GRNRQPQGPLWSAVIHHRFPLFYRLPLTSFGCAWVARTLPSSLLLRPSTLTRQRSVPKWRKQVVQSTRSTR
ncbi:MAG: hypothetical protein PHO07_11910, partial [Pirellulales bacterium]|nr:hypothetical protein [Pirellulales bacterium]